MRNPVAKILLILGLIIVVVIAAFVIRRVLPTGALPPLPASNGYSNVVRSARTIVIPQNDFRERNQEQLQSLVASNPAALQSIRSNLEGTIQVPLAYSINYSAKALGDLTEFKRVAMGFLAESQLAQMGIEAQRPTWEQILNQEHYWSSRTFPGVRYLVIRFFTSRSTGASEARTEQKFKTVQAHTRELMIGLAARAYKLGNGCPPARTADLVPNYLSKIPLDPFTGTNMTYLP